MNDLSEVIGAETFYEYDQDSIEGIYPRWHVGFNITMLRLISFNMDYYWACNRVGLTDASGPFEIWFPAG